MVHGKYKYPDGSQYNGEWSEQNQRHGSGEMKFPDGAQYKGNFELGLCHGTGVMTFTDGSRLVLGYILLAKALKSCLFH